MGAVGCGGTLTAASSPGPVIYGYSATAVDSVPMAIESYPSVYWNGAPAYLVDDTWYYRGGGGWVILQEEPRDLYRYRIAARPRSPVEYRYSPAYRGTSRPVAPVYRPPYQGSPVPVESAPPVRRRPVQSAPPAYRPPVQSAPPAYRPPVQSAPPAYGPPVQSAPPVYRPPVQSSPPVYKSVPAPRRDNPVQVAPRARRSSPVQSAPPVIHEQRRPR